MLTTNLAIVTPVTEADDRAARETVWQQVTERIVPQMGKLCTRFEPSGGCLLYTSRCYLQIESYSPDLQRSEARESD